MGVERRKEGTKLENRVPSCFRGAAGKQSRLRQQCPGLQSWHLAPSQPGRAVLQGQLLFHSTVSGGVISAQPGDAGQWRSDDQAGPLEGREPLKAGVSRHIRPLQASAPSWLRGPWLLTPLHPSSSCHFILLLLLFWRSLTPSPLEKHVLHHHHHRYRCEPD